MANDPRQRQGPLIFGEVLFDCFEDGSRTLGGAPFNVAWHLKAFGLDPLLVSRVGEDAPGREILAAMRRWGLSTDGIQRDDRHRTGEVRVAVHRGQPEFRITDQCAYDHICLPDLGGWRPSLLYHGTLALRHDGSRGTLKRLLDRIAAPVFVDVNLRNPWWRRDTILPLLSSARWLKINEAELDLLAEPTGTIRERAADMLSRHRLERIIVTLGDQGAFAIGRDGECHAAAPAARLAVVDAVGAGDAFAAACILGLHHGWRWPTIMHRAQRFASLLVTRRGALIDDLDTYRMLDDEWRAGGDH